LEEANRFLSEQYISQFNERFSVTAAAEGTAFVACLRTDLDRVFAVQHERVVARDNTVQFARLCLQIERQQWRSTLSGCRVTVYEHLDGTLSLGFGAHTVGRYNSEGMPLKSSEERSARGVKKQVMIARSAKTGTGHIMC
jgi:hypothetical protein